MKTDYINMKELRDIVTSADAVNGVDDFVTEMSIELRREECVRKTAKAQNKLPSIKLFWKHFDNLNRCVTLLKKSNCETEDEQEVEDKRYILSRNDFIGTYMKVIYRFAPGNLPRNPNMIARQLKSYFRTNTKEFATNIKDEPLPETNELINYPHLTDDQIYKIVDRSKHLSAIKDLSLSRNEHKNKTKNVDPNRIKFASFGLGYVTSEDDDFIDLDALVRNVYDEIMLELVVKR